MINNAPFRLGWVILLSWIVSTVLAASVMEVEWFFSRPAEHKNPSFLLAMAWITFMINRIYFITGFVPAAFLIVKIKWFWVRFILAFAICTYPTHASWFPIGRVQTYVDIIGFVIGVAILVLFSFLTAKFIESRRGAISH